MSVQVSKHSKTCTECPYKLTILLQRKEEEKSTILKNLTPNKYFILNIYYYYFLLLHCWKKNSDIKNNCSPKSLAQSSARIWVRGSVLDLARAWRRARNYTFSRASRPRIGSGICSRLVKLGALPGTRLGLAWLRLGEQLISVRASLARSSTQLGPVLTSVRYLLLVPKLNVISPDQLVPGFGSAQLEARFGSVLFGSRVWFVSARS